MRSIALGMRLNEQLDVLTAEPSHFSPAETRKAGLFAGGVIIHPRFADTQPIRKFGNREKPLHFSVREESVRGLEME